MYIKLPFYRQTRKKCLIWREFVIKIRSAGAPRGGPATKIAEGTSIRGAIRMRIRGGNEKPTKHQRERDEE